MEPLYCRHAWDSHSALISEVSLFQGCPYRRVQLYIYYYKDNNIFWAIGLIVQSILVIVHLIASICMCVIVLCEDERLTQYG